MIKDSKQIKGGRIGIYAGTFNPVHVGHIAFALQAMQVAHLDSVVFLPERRPRYKPGVEHFAHRVAMLKSAVRPHQNMAVLELVDRYFTVQRTCPQLQAIFPNATLVMLMGTDEALRVPMWPHAERMLADSELVVGVRQNHELRDMQATLRGWAVQPKRLYVFESFEPDISSGEIRIAIRRRYHVRGLLSSVQQYARRNWLYVSLENS